MFFKDEFELVYNDNVYHVQVEGSQYEDEDDSYRTYTDIKRFWIWDENGDLVNKTHPDYDDLEEEVMSRDYEVETEAKGLDFYDDGLSEL